MAEILDRRRVCDGYDVRILTGGAAYTLHFLKEPDKAVLADRIAAFEESLKPPPPVVLDARVESKLALSANRTALTSLEKLLADQSIEAAVKQVSALAPEEREKALLTSPTLARLVELGRRLA
jgi:hypothetical protein